MTPPFAIVFSLLVCSFSVNTDRTIRQTLPIKNKLVFFEKVWTTVDKHYVPPEGVTIDWGKTYNAYEPKAIFASSDEQFYSHLYAMVNELKDQDSRFLSPEAALKLNKSVGWGMIVHQVGSDTLRVGYVFEGSPAATIGIRPGESILAFNGVPVNQWDGTFSESTSLNLLSEDKSEKRSVTLGAADYTPSAEVKASSLDEELKYGYVEVHNLAATNAIEEVFAAFDQLLKYQNLQGIVFDLRDCVGGYAKEASSVLSLFASGKFGHFNGKGYQRPLKVGRNKLQESLASKPIVVLTNQGTSDAAEIVALNLQTIQRVQVFGQPTQGHTSFISSYEFDGGARLLLTTERYQSANGLANVTPHKTLPFSSRLHSLKEDPWIAQAQQFLSR